MSSGASEVGIGLHCGFNLGCFLASHGEQRNSRTNWKSLYRTSAFEGSGVQKAPQKVPKTASGASLVPRSLGLALGAMLGRFWVPTGSIFRRLLRVPFFIDF